MSKWKRFRLFWRSNGSIILLIGIFGSIAIGNNLLLGITELLMLTIPCGAQKINTTWWLWYPRQLLFCVLAVDNFLFVYGI